MAWNLKNYYKRLFVLSLDGVPYSFLKGRFSKGHLPYLNQLFKPGGFKRMYSVLPPVSSVAWSTYMTGKNPAGHNIFGFIDRSPDPLKLFIPTSTNMKAKPIWEILSKEGKRVIVINVPVTTPPKPVNGILISGFLSPSIEKGVFPPSLIPRLKEWGYQIDIDAEQARKDRKAFLEDLKTCTKKRFEIATRLMDKEPWDFFHLHIMGTDRINHFLWRSWENNDPVFAHAFEDYYGFIDMFIGQTLLPFLESKKETGLIILSDHGFCCLKKEVFLNKWLRDHGWLILRQDVSSASVEDIDAKTRAYSLIPGRIYINLKGREGCGLIDPLKYDPVLKELKEEISLIKDPETGERIIDRVFLKNKIYKGAYINQAPDMVVLSVNGYDLKGNVDRPSYVQESDLEGMHTFDDAFLFINDHEIKQEEFSILDVTPSVFKLLGINPCPDFEGLSLI